MVRSYNATAWVTALLFLQAAPLAAEVREDFEQPEAAWRLAEADGPVKPLAHERTFAESHSGHGSEHFRLLLGAGNKVYLSYDLPAARAIAELKLSLWMKSDRVGPQLFARVVLPHSREPRSDRPLTMLIPGGSYSEADAWQRLAIEDVPLLIERQARVLRTQFGPDVDTRGAYIDKLVINAYTEPGMIQVWLDDLEVTGHVAVADSGVKQAQHAAEIGPPRARVALDGSLITTDGRPTQLRIVEHRGESLEWLQTLGFNCVLLREPASDEQLAEATRLGLWLIAPPPPDITAAQGSILGWLLGTKLGPADLEATRNLARELRVSDAAARPLFAGAAASLSSYSRTAGVLFVEPPVFGGSFELTDYAAWFAERPRLARPGTPLVALLPSEPPAAVMNQLAAIAPRAGVPQMLDYEQLRLLTLTAAASGLRGVAFASQTKLDGTDPAARQRADMLRLLNAELKLIEPWMAAGTYAGDVVVDDPAVRVSVLEAERAKLLIVRRYAPGQQYAIAPPEKDRVTLVLPGTSSSTHAYRLTTLGMEPLVHRRVTGGTHVAIEAAGCTSLVVLTQDPLVMNRVARDLGALESQHARLRYDIAARRLAATEETLALLPSAAAPNAVRQLEQARANTQQALRLLSANDRRGADKYVRAAEHELAALERGHFLAASQAFASPVESPLCTRFGTLAAHYELADRLRGAAWSENVLAGGDMERLETLVESGWRNQRDPSIAVETSVEIAPQFRTGQSSLRLAVTAPPQSAPAVIESPPVWVVTPALPVARGKLVRIRGFVRTSPAIVGSHDGVLIFDSVGGRALAERIRPTESWRQFTLYRAVGEENSLTVTFALTGLGEAWLDDVEIALLDIPPSRAAPSLEPMSIDEPEEIAPPRTRAEELPPPTARGWWPRLR